MQTGSTETKGLHGFGLHTVQLWYLAAGMVLLGFEAFAHKNNDIAVYSLPQRRTAKQALRSLASKGSCDVAPANAIVTRFGDRPTLLDRPVSSP